MKRISGWAQASIVCSACALGLGCNDAAPAVGAGGAPAVAAGTGAAGTATGAAGTATGAAGTTTGAAGTTTGAAGTATGAAGTATGAAGTATGAAGTGTAGVGAAGGGAAGTGTAGTGTAGTGSLTAGGPAPGAPTLSAIYDEIITGTGCNGGPTCHSGEVAGKLKMTSAEEMYMNLVGVKSTGMNIAPGATTMNCKDTGLTRVVAGDPANSLFMKKLEDKPPCGDRMPPGGMLTAAQLTQIRTWIMNGAKKD